MGTFMYGTSVRVEIEDRALAHLQVVISDKLRRDEPFPFVWRDEVGFGGGRTAVWLHPRGSFVFQYRGGRMPLLNSAWIDALAFAASAPTGLYLVPEPTLPLGELPVSVRS